MSVKTVPMFGHQSKLSLGTRERLYLFLLTAHVTERFLETLVGISEEAGAKGAAEHFLLGGKNREFQLTDGGIGSLHADLKSLFSAHDIAEARGDYFEKKSCHS